MRPRWRKKKKKETQGCFLKCQTIAALRGSLWFNLLLAEKKKRRYKLSSQPICDALAWAFEPRRRPALCVARRHCGKFHRGALRHTAGCGEILRVRTERDTVTQTPFIPTTFLYVFLPFPPLCATLSHPLPHWDVRAREDFPPAHSQRDFPESAFDLSTMLGGALSVHTVVGLLGKSNQHAVTYVGDIFKYQKL